MISYAQNFEDVMLARALGDRASGFYVDVGACYPDIASVTRHFYEVGWTGVNVEPMEDPFARLRAVRPRDVNVNAAIASYSGEIAMFQGASIGESSALRPYETARAIVVPCLTLEELCKRHVDRPIDFLKIDVEGLERDVVMSGDWQRYRPDVVVIEVTRPWTNERRPDAVEIGDFLRGRGYDEVFFDGLNAFFLAREASSLATRFSCPANVLDRFTLAREAELEATMATLKEHAESVGRRLSEIETQAGASERDANALAARAATAEVLVQQAERVNAELRDVLREKESLLLNAQRAWQDGVATVERLQAAFAKATSELQVAELRARELAQASTDAAQRAESAARDANAAMTAARAAEARAQTAEARTQVAEARVAQSEARLQQVEARSREAEANAQTAEARAQTAEARTQVAEARVEQSEARLQQVEARSREAEANARAAETRAVQDAVRAQQTEALALRAEAIVRDLEARSHESEVREHRAVAHALQAEDTIASMLRSRSWRVTAPLRAVADFIRGGPRGAPSPAASARRTRLNAVRANALRGARTLAKRTALYRWAAPRLKRRYPKLWMHARAAAENTASAPTFAGPPAGSHGPASAGVRAPDTTSDAIPANATIEELTLRIQREIARRRAP